MTVHVAGRGRADAPPPVPLRDQLASQRNRAAGLTVAWSAGAWWLYRAGHPVLATLAGLMGAGAAVRAAIAHTDRAGLVPFAD